MIFNIFMIMLLTFHVQTLWFENDLTITALSDFLQ